MGTVRRVLVVVALSAGTLIGSSTAAFALQTPTTGQPGTTAGFNCGTASAPVEPGNAAAAPGSAFNETGPGHAGTVYAGNGVSADHAGSTAAVSQYDSACRQLSSH